MKIRQLAILMGLIVPLLLARGGELEVTAVVNMLPKSLPLIVADRTTNVCGVCIVDPVLSHKDHRLANVVVSLNGSPIAVQNTSTESNSDTLLLKAEGCLFTPRVQATRVGSILQIGSGDPTPHNPHGWFNGLFTVFNITVPDTTTTFKRQLKRSGVYRVDCDTHPWMHAYIHVFDGELFAVTNGEGKATFKGLQTGNYILHAWHEVLGVVQTNITVSSEYIKSVSVTFALQDLRGTNLIPRAYNNWLEEGSD